MIIGFVGTPGSGKTYEAVKKIVDNLRKGRVVWTNIDGLDKQESQEAIKSVASLDDYKLSEQLHYLTDVQCREFWLHVTPGSLILIDEVHKLFSNRNWNSEGNKEFTEWASTHRHHGYDVVLITQDLEKIDKHARSLIEWTYFFRKINQFGSLVTNSYHCFSYMGDDHNGKPLSTTKRKYDKAIFSCYSSYVAQDVKELGIMSHVNLLKHPVFYAIPIVFCAFLYFFFHSSLATGDIFGTKKAQAAGMAAIEKNKKETKTDEKPGVKPITELSTETRETGNIQTNKKGQEGKEIHLPDEIGSSVITKNYLSDHRILYANVADIYLKPGVTIIKSEVLKN